MAKRGGMHKYEKRQKELKRKKKQEEKRLRRQKSSSAETQDAEAPESVDSSVEPQPAEDE